MSFSRFFKYVSFSAVAASASVLNNVTSIALELSNSSANSTTDDDTSNIDFSSKDAIIGISCIAASMALITAFFCKKYGKMPQTKTASLDVIVKKDHADSVANQIVIPQIGLYYAITPAGQELIQQIGERKFLRDEISRLINQRIKDDENFEMSESSIKQVMTAFFGKNNLSSQLGIHDSETSVTITYKPQNKRSHFFERSLQPLTRATLFFEIVFSLIQNIGSLQLFGGVLPVSREANDDIAITQAVLDALFLLLITYVGPGQTFMNDLGAIIDKFLHQCCQRKNAAQEDEEKSEASEDELLPATRYKIKFTKGIITVFLINSLYTQVIRDYKTAVSLADNIAAMPDSMIPPWLVMLSAYLMYGLNQLNDPVNFISTVFMFFTLIDMYFKHQQTAQTQIQELHDEREQKADEEQGNVVALIPIKPTPLRALSRFSPPPKHRSNLEELLLPPDDDHLDRDKPRLTIN